LIKLKLFIHQFACTCIIVSNYYCVDCYTCILVFFCRVPLTRGQRPIEKIWEMGLTRSDLVARKYGGDAPEPLTDYQDVSLVS